MVFFTFLYALPQLEGDVEVILQRSLSPAGHKEALLTPEATAPPTT
jgi:hypothetical protein